MSAWLLSAFAAAQLMIGAPDALAPIQVADGADIILQRGNSRRPEVEVPSNQPPAGTEMQPSAAEGVDPGAVGGERALGTRGLGAHRPGELYLPPGDHRPGDLDNQGTFRPGDMG